MADSNKSIVVIASVLKPVDDSRMYEKIGLTLSGSGKYDVHIIGPDSSQTKAPSETPGISQHAFQPFRRISLFRLFAPWRIMILAMRLRPRIFIIATHELLWVALLMKMIRGCCIIYDVQENYYWNILYTSAFPLLVKPFLALYVRGKEVLSARYIDHFLLAEKGYQHELKFTGSNYTVIENKLRVDKSTIKRETFDPEKKDVNLLFSGTIAETTGVFTAIDLAIKLHVIDDRIRLTIIGSCLQHRTMERIRLLIQTRPFIQLIARESAIPHSEILAHIRLADFGLVTYQVNPSTMNSIPTKLYEYLGFQLPFILVNHRPWADFCLPYTAAIVFDANHFDAAAIHRDMMTKRFYTSEPAVVYWQSEEPRLLESVRRVLE